MTELSDAAIAADAAPLADFPALLPAPLTAPPELAPPSDGSRALWSVIERLEQAIDHETNELLALRSADFNRLNEIKSRLLLDASRALRAMQQDGSDGALIARLASLRLKLEYNRMVIGMHLEAVRDIAAAMTSTLLDAESDGTYSATTGLAPAPAARLRAS